MKSSSEMTSSTIQSQLSFRWKMSMKMLVIFLCSFPRILYVEAHGGSWELLVRNEGIASMHTMVTYSGNSIIYDYKTNTVVRTLPRLEGPPCNYPSPGSSVMLPLMADDGYTKCEFLVCGGAKYEGWGNPQVPAADDCDRIDLSDPASNWAKETMPFARTMGDMVMLPNLHTLIINGAQTGSQGWGNPDNPALSPVEYDPYELPDHDSPP
ncbi:hypothetical protein R1sor_002020 [Riccia sorocarpa]|uniref:Glyoxal oxidase N-terminal domain-containing protein n=1 Tax=Riccia sorocarpa TaxID=122646 RepID=A0ABD3GXZ2_9MARC